MYRENDGHTTVYDFILPFGRHLKEDNRWVKLHNTIDWEIIDDEGHRNFENKLRTGSVSIIRYVQARLYPEKAEAYRTGTGQSECREPVYAVLH